MTQYLKKTSIVKGFPFKVNALSVGEFPSNTVAIAAAPLLAILLSDMSKLVRHGK